MGKFYFAFAWDIIVNLHVCICKNKICIWSDPGVNLPICKYTPVCICVRMRHLLTPSKICTPEYIYTCVFLAHANWTLVFATWIVQVPFFLNKIKTEIRNFKLLTCSCDCTDRFVSELVGNLNYVFPWEGSYVKLNLGTLKHFVIDQNFIL